MVTIEKRRPVVCTLKELLEQIDIGKKGTSKVPKKTTVVDVMSDFTPSAYWQELKPLKFGVSEPISTIPNIFAPTNPVCGNNYVAANMGKNSMRRLHYFKCFFACQNPIVSTAERKNTL